MGRVFFFFLPLCRARLAVAPVYSLYGEIINSGLSSRYKHSSPLFNKSWAFKVTLHVYVIDRDLLTWDRRDCFAKVFLITEIPETSFSIIINRPSACLTVWAILAFQGSIFSVASFRPQVCPRPPGAAGLTTDPLISSCFLISSFFDIGCFDNCCAFGSFSPFESFSLWPHAFSFCFFSAPPQHQTIF